MYASSLSGPARSLARLPSTRPRMMSYITNSFSLSLLYFIWMEEEEENEKISRNQINFLLLTFFIRREFDMK